MANSETFTKLINIDINSQSVSSLNKSLKEIDDEIKSIQENEVKVNQSLEEQEASLKKISQLEESRNKITKEKGKLEEKSVTNSEKTAKNLENQQKKAEQLFKTAEGVGGAFQVAAGASLLLGEETGEALAKAQAKVVAIISVTDGLKKVTEGAAAGYKLVSENLKKAEVGAKLFGNSTKAAVAATGIGLLVIALVLIIEYFDEISAAAKRFSQAIGLDKVLEDFNAFFDSIGGLSGVFTVLGGAVEGFFKAVVGYFKILGKLMQFDFKGVKEEFVKTQEEITKAVKESVDKAQAAEAQRRLIKAKELAIKESEQEIAILKARGKDTLKLEEDLIKKRIDLQDTLIKNTEKGSKEELELIEKKNAQLVALEANAKAQADKLFNDRLKSLESRSNNEIFIINKKIKDENIAESKGQELLLLQQKSTLQRELTLRSKHGEDVIALKLKLQQLDQQLEENLNKQREEALEKSFSQELIILQESRLQGLLSQEAYADELSKLEIKQLEKSLSLAEVGGKEQLDLQKSLNDKKIALLDSSNAKEIAKKKELTDKQKALDDYLLKQSIDRETAILNNTKASFKDRKEANQNLNDILTSQNEKALKAAEEAYGQDSLEYKKAADEKIKIEEQFQAKRAELLAQQVASTLQTSQAVVNTISSINQLVNQITQNQIDESQDKIEGFQEQNDEIDQNITNLQERSQESIDKQNELEAGLTEARGERSSILREQLEEEKGNRRDLLIQQNEETKKKIENEKKIEVEKQKIEKLEKDRKKRQQALDIITATIQTALGVVQALGSTPPPLSFVLAALVGVAGAASIATIASQKYADGGVLEGPSHDQGGIRGTGRFSNIEVEGGEFIVNKRATSQYRNVLESINGGAGVPGNKFAEGGTVPNFDNVNSITSTTNGTLQAALDKPIFVSVQEFNTVNTRVKTIEDDSSF